MSEELRLLVEFTHEHDIHRILARPVTFAENRDPEIQGVGDRYRPENKWHVWQDLEISCYVAKPGEFDTPTYGIHFHYRPHEVELEDAKRILTGLSKLERGMDRLRVDFGYPQSFEDWFARVAAVLGVKRFGIVRSRNARGFFANTEWQWTDVSGIRSWITRQISEFREPKEVSAEAR